MLETSLKDILSSRIPEVSAHWRIRSIVRQDPVLMECRFLMSLLCSYLVKDEVLYWPWIQHLSTIQRPQAEMGSISKVDNQCYIAYSSMPLNEVVALHVVPLLLQFPSIFGPGQNMSNDQRIPNFPDMNHTQWRYYPLVSDWAPSNHISNHPILWSSLPITPMKCM